MSHNFQKILAPFGRKSPKDRLEDTSIYAKPWIYGHLLRCTPTAEKESSVKSK